MRLITLIFLSLLLCQCSPINLYERTANIPQHAWRSDFKPSFSFDITDTTSSHEVSLILRHTDAYPFNNIWLDIRVESPDSLFTIRTEQRLGNNEQGWLGTGLNDVYEHRILLNGELGKAGLLKSGPASGKATFRKVGKYTFQLAQVMRKDPLPNVLQAGIRVERKP
jgi:gliding motility-associated lipoprotein GldH